MMLEAGATLPEYQTRRALRRRYVTSSSKAPTSPYVDFVAPQPNAEIHLWPRAMGETTTSKITHYQPIPRNQPVPRKRKLRINCF